MTPLVSVVTPFWPPRATMLVQRAIPSVERQTYPNVEHIIVSDGPIEGAPPAMCIPGLNRWYYSLGRDTTAFFENPCPAVMPCAVGALLARGELIAYLNDDDQWESDYIAEMVSLLERTGADFATCKQKIVDDSGIKQPWYTERGNRAFPVHRVELLKIAHRPLGGKPGAPLEDRELCDRWLRGGAIEAWLDEPLLIHHEDYSRTGGHALAEQIGQVVMAAERDGR